MTTEKRRTTLKEFVELFRTSFPDGQTFVVSPDIRRELLIDGLDKHGLEFCHELAGDGIHEHSRGISGSHLRFKRGPDGNQDSQSGQEGVIQDSSRRSTPRLRGSGGAKNTGGKKGRSGTQSESSDTSDGGVGEGLRRDEPLGDGEESSS